MCHNTHDKVTWNRADDIYVFKRESHPIPDYEIAKEPYQNEDRISAGDALYLGRAGCVDR